MSKSYSPCCHVFEHELRQRPFNIYFRIGSNLFYLILTLPLVYLSLSLPSFCYQPSGLHRLVTQSYQVPPQPLPTPMDTQPDGADHQSQYAAFVAEASVREAALQMQVGLLSEQLAAARYFFFPSHYLCSISFELIIFHSVTPTSLNQKEKDLINDKSSNHSHLKSLLQPPSSAAVPKKRQKSRPTTKPAMQRYRVLPAELPKDSSGLYVRFVNIII